MLSYCRSLFSQELASISPLWHFTERFAFLEIKLFSQNLFFPLRNSIPGVHLDNTIPTIQQATTGSTFPKMENTIFGLQGQM